MSQIMRRTLRRSVLAAGGTLLAGAITRKWIAPEAAAQSSPEQSPPVQPFSVVRFHAPTALPPFSFADADGRTIDSAQPRGHGVVLNLWATWCVPCVAELPALDSLARTLAPSGIQVLTVSLDHGGAAMVKPFYAAHGIRSLPVLLDPHSAILAALGLEGIPTTLVIDKTGKEVARVQGSVNWADPAAAIAITKAIGS